MDNFERLIIAKQYIKILNTEIGVLKSEIDELKHLKGFKPKADAMRNLRLQLNNQNETIIELRERIRMYNIL